MTTPHKGLTLVLDGASVVFTTREDGNLGLHTDDDRERVLANRRRLAERAGVELAWGRQVHGSEIKEWDAAGGEVEEVDGHTTTAPHLGLLVVVADCYPVALAGGGRVAMLHCGWRGLAGGIVEKAVARFGEPPAAAVGPGIGGCCYEVGDEVLAAFADVDGAARGRMLDLRRVVESKLRRAGVSEIQHVDHCTSCREDLYFSHRRDRGRAGRQGGLVWRD